MRRGWVVRQDLDHLETILLAAARGDLWPSTVFSPVSCMNAAKTNSGFCLGLADGPAGEAAGDRDDILLGVAAVDS